MQRSTERKLTLSEDEVAEAIVYWLRHSFNAPCPGAFADVTINHDGHGSLQVSWTVIDTVGEGAICPTESNVMEKR